jgi:hypothetical protein
MQMFVGVEFGAERAILLIITKLVIAGDTGVSLHQAPDRLVDLGDLDELSVGDAFCKLVDIGAQAPFLLGTDGAIFGDALLAAAEHVDLLVCRLGFDLNRRLLLPGVERGTESSRR